MLAMSATMRTSALGSSLANSSTNSVWRGIFRKQCSYKESRVGCTKEGGHAEKTVSVARSLRSFFNRMYVVFVNKVEIGW